VAFAWESAGSSIAAKTAMMAMTTNNSINVNADLSPGPFTREIGMCFVLIWT
jgi:hypothetical protein